LGLLTGYLTPEMLAASLCSGELAFVRASALDRQRTAVEEALAARKASQIQTVSERGEEYLVDAALQACGLCSQTVKSAGFATAKT
jgi:hypothetical protein